MKSDANADKIVSALRDAGCVVRYLECPFGVGGLPDLLVGWMGQTWLLELKVKGGRLNPKQKAFHASWKGGPLRVVHSIQEAFEAVGIVAPF